MSAYEWERRKPGGEVAHSEPAVTAEPAAQPLGAGRASYQREVQRKAAAASLPAVAPELSVVQRKGKEEGAAPAEAPSAGQVGSATIHALQSHMKLTAMRMYAVAANMHTILGGPTNTEAGVEPMMQALQGQFDLILGDLARLNGEIDRVPALMRGAMSEEISLLRGAWYDNRGLNRALSSVYSFTHDKDGNPRTDASSYTGSITAVQNQLRSIYASLHLDEGDINNRYLARGADVADSLGEATTEAFDSGLYAVQVCTRRILADLDSMDDKDADITAADLLAVVSEAAASSKGITKKNLGNVKRVVHDVEAMQAELARRSGPKIAKLAKQIGYNSNVSTNLHALHQRMDQVAKGH